MSVARCLLRPARPRGETDCNWPIRPPADEPYLTAEVPNYVPSSELYVFTLRSTTVC